MLRIVEIFNSVQGEAGHTGYPCAFVRLARCNIRCGYCDTTYSFGAGEQWSQEDVVTHVNDYGVRHVCITGGEPMLHGEAACALMSAFLDLDYTVLLETNGIIELDSVPSDVIKIMDIKTPGALGMDANDPNFIARHLHRPNLDTLNSKDEIKFVLTGREDYEWAKSFIADNRLLDVVDHIYLSPSWNDLPAKELVTWILADKLPVKLNLQIHKYIWDAETQGV